MDTPENLIELEHKAEEERGRLASVTDDDEYQAQRQRWHGAAAAVQAAIAAHAEAVGLNRYELEQAVKKAVRYPTEGAGE